MTLQELIDELTEANTILQITHNRFQEGSSNIEQWLNVLADLSHMVTELVSDINEENF